MTILITGGTGYIGSHIAAELISCGERVVVMDNGSNSHVLDVAQNLLTLMQQRGASTRCLTLDVADITNFDDVVTTIEEYRVESIIHCAGLKSVADSMTNQAAYFHQNVGGLSTVLAAMQATGVRKLVFSSSATVYGDIREPAHEDLPHGKPTSVYGRTKQMCEDMIKAFDKDTAILRYFNPIGAHTSGLLKDNPSSTPNNLMPILCSRSQTNSPLHVFGNDYDTVDGTCERDYIHVCDLAEAHVAALNFIADRGSIVANLGTGKATTVLELLEEFNKHAKNKVVPEFVARRSGDVASLYSEPSVNAARMGWLPRRSLADMCKDTVNAFNL